MTAQFINHTNDGIVPDDVRCLKQFTGMLHKDFSDIYVDIHEKIGESNLIAICKTI